MNANTVAYAHIIKRSGVKGGCAVVDGTRVPVNIVIACVKRGDLTGEILREYPLLTCEHIAECLAYYEDHREEIDALIRINSDLYD